MALEKGDETRTGGFISVFEQVTPGADRKEAQEENCCRTRTHPGGPVHLGKLMANIQWAMKGQKEDCSLIHWEES